ncbi:hypothetical protein RHMOL_Rhmol10G0226300 [Rhododendron molle]|uniref:Uncharacterized protein n=1 Tax=Rhododendron molle TaxID=49168 RepID=A0ACC0M5C1_RHOML|nr:hypothetical protein RHMOL_Rhmol10G0226300 [Rhododendron molle]
MSMTPRKLMCFCYSGCECMANTDGSLGKYMDGVSEVTVIEGGISSEELVVKVCSRMNMSHDGKSLFYSTSRDKSKHLHMRDADSVSMMFCLNEDKVDIVVKEKTLANTKTMELNLLNSSPSIVAGEPPSTSKDSLTICHEMGLVPYSQRRGEDILSGDGQLFDNHRLFKKTVILFAALNKFTFKVEAQLLIYATVMSPIPLHDMPSSIDMVPQIAEIQYGCEGLDIATSSSTAMEAFRPPATK